MSGKEKGKFARLGGDAARFYFDTGSIPKVCQMLIKKHGVDGEVSEFSLHNWKRRGRWRQVRAELSALETEDALLQAFEGRIESMVATLSGCVMRLREQIRAMKDGKSDN